MNDIDLAREAARRIVAKVSPQAVYWFGSRADGCGAPDSNFDLFVVLDEGPHYGSVVVKQPDWVQEGNTLDVGLPVTDPPRIKLRLPAGKR